MFDRVGRQRHLSAMIRLFACVVVAALSVSCSASFEREWREALRKGSRQGAEGAWEGTWQSQVNGHHGRLRCVVAEGATDGERVFHYHATWADTLSGSYRAVHRVARSRGGFVFAGSHRLPAWAGGLYQYEGKIQGDDFLATYHCRLDHGCYRMKRVTEKR